MTDIETKAQRVALQEFEGMDANGDGSVDADDFLRAPRRLLAALGMAEESPKGRALLDANQTQWSFLLSLGDGDGDEALSAREYVDARTSPAFRAPGRPGKGDVCRTLFDVLDADDSGTLTQDEFLRAARYLHMSESEAGAYFAELDTNGDGRVDLQEFLKAVKRFYTS